MRLWTKKQQLDERLTHLQNKIFRELYTLVLIICSVSIGYKMIQGTATNEGIWTEGLILFGGAVFYLVRSMMLGILTDEVGLPE